MESGSYDDARQAGLQRLVVGGSVTGMRGAEGWGEEKQGL